MGHRIMKDEDLGGLISSRPSNQGSKTLRLGGLGEYRTPHINLGVTMKHIVKETFRYIAYIIVTIVVMIPVWILLIGGAE